MTDYGHELRFGVSLDPSVPRLAEAYELARDAEAAGLDFVAVQDHPYQPDYLDTLSLLEAVALRTERIGLFTDVLDLALRPPTMAAKTAASLAVLTGRRIDLGVGGGGFPQGITSMGGQRRTPGQTITYTEESLHVLRHALEGGKVRLLSTEHRIEGYQAGPVADPRPNVYLGAQHRRMLGVVGRASDGWVSPLNIYVPPEEVLWRQELIDDAARSVGRDPSDVRRIYNVIGYIGNATRGTGLIGDAQLWADTLSSWATDLGYDTFVYWPLGHTRSQLEVFTSQVVPAVRAQVREIRRSR
ncbi:LLM class flavin-dependent oxidoreductase [Pseudonocardia thermophila]|uniref:LLM class flavin-dependent oxidoreductase n=1 Tax=Pseudonocardia thermophila TaxID=1848 RepID=UPI00248D51B4|nr:LLM class flavin-dependent oxidoreductase [Pseudonocardia thermophila]